MDKLVSRLSLLSGQEITSVNYGNSTELWKYSEFTQALSGREIQREKKLGEMRSAELSKSDRCVSL